MKRINLKRDDLWQRISLDSFRFFFFINNVVNLIWFFIPQMGYTIIFIFILCSFIEMYVYMRKYTSAICCILRTCTRRVLLWHEFLMYAKLYAPCRRDLKLISLVCRVRGRVYFLGILCEYIFDMFSSVQHSTKKRKMMLIYIEIVLLCISSRE